MSYPGLLSVLLENTKKSGIYKLLFENDSCLLRDIKIPVIKNDYINISTYRNIKFEGNSYAIHHKNDADIMNIKKLIIERENPESPLEIDNIEIQIGGQTVIQIPYFIIKALHNITNPDPCTTIIDIDIAKYINNLLIINLIYHDVKLIVNTPSMENIKKISFIAHAIFLNREGMIHIPRAPYFMIPIHQFETIHFKGDIESTNNKIDLPFKKLSQGLFINLPLNNVSNISIVGNGAHELYNYDKYTLGMVAKSLSPDAFSLPFNIYDAYSIYDFNSYKNALLFSRVDKVTMTIETTVLVKDITLSSMNANVYHYKSGMGGVGY